MIIVYIDSLYANIIKIEHALITADLLNQKPTKKVMLLHKRCFN